ncbi:hypothetical protein JTE90_029343 [Oedothorax gibbosus]|uniref:Uncharacterized protein n=1 Tax=Oedothorax gibbosus TaxID=931172 RepID=A0AAV6UJ95_9ARAC|nr:hypothetical protein JTE90_029343 [Oedothorax gibbosus]
MLASETAAPDDDVYRVLIVMEDHPLDTEPGKGLGKGLGRKPPWGQGRRDASDKYIDINTILFTLKRRLIVKVVGKMMLFSIVSYGFQIIKLMMALIR